MGLAAFNALRRQKLIKEKKIKIDDLTINELRSTAKDKGVKNTFSMKKDELIKALKGE